MNHKAVYRTAPATPGLLIISLIYIYIYIVFVDSLQILNHLEIQILLAKISFTIFVRKLERNLIFM